MSEIRTRKRPVLAIDLGGTKIIAALISPKGEILAKERHPTLAEQGLDSVVRRMFAAMERVLSLGNMRWVELGGISLAVAGAIDMEKGMITKSPNLPGWLDIPLRNMVQEKYKVETFLINDANAAALGEHRFGAGRGAENLVYVTVSTGIGGGIIIDGKLYFGATGGAGELGHMTIDVDGTRCYCGNIGCWEELASGRAIAREAIRRIKQGEKSSLTEMVVGELGKITAEQISLAARNGDSLALEVIARAAAYLGVGMVNLVNIFNPEVIIVGGGVAKMGELLFEPARRMIKESAFPLLAQAVRLVPAQLGDDAGVLGAAVFAWQEDLRRRTRKS